MKKKYFFFSFFRISKTNIFTLDSLSTNGGQDINFTGYQII